MKVRIKTVAKHNLNISAQNGDIIFVSNKFNNPLGDCTLN